MPSGYVQEECRSGIDLSGGDPTHPLPTHPSPSPSSPSLQGEACDLVKLGQHLRNNYVPNTAIIDCTASDVPAANYLGWMHQV